MARLDAVRTMPDMLAYARILFGDCVIEDLLPSFWSYSGCSLIRVKNACLRKPWIDWDRFTSELKAKTQGGIHGLWGT